MSAQSVVLYSSLPSASHWYYHIIISPNSRKSPNDCDAGRKQGHTLNGSMKTGNNNISLWMWEGSGSLEEKHCDRSCLLVVIVMIQQKKSETYFFSLQWKTARLSALQLLRLPPSPVSPSKTSFKPLWMWHAGNTMRQARTQTTLPLAPLLYCGTRWEEMLGQGKLKWGICTHG